MPQLPNVTDSSSLPSHLTLTGDTPPPSKSPTLIPPQDTSKPKPVPIRDSIVLTDSDDVEIVHRATQVSITSTASPGSRSPSLISPRRLSNVSEIGHEGFASDKRSLSPLRRGAPEPPQTTTPSTPFLVLPSQQKRQQVFENEPKSPVQQPSSENSSIASSPTAPETNFSVATRPIESSPVKERYNNAGHLDAEPSNETEPEPIQEAEAQTAHSHSRFLDDTPQYEHQNLNTTSPQPNDTEPGQETVSFTASQFDNYMEDITKRAQKLSVLSDPLADSTSGHPTPTTVLSVNAERLRSTEPELAHAAQEIAPGPSYEPARNTMLAERDHESLKEATYSESHNEDTYNKEAFESEDGGDIFDYYRDSANDDEEEDSFSVEKDVAEVKKVNSLPGATTEVDMTTDYGPSRTLSTSTVVKTDKEIVSPVEVIAKSPMLDQHRDWASAPNSTTQSTGFDTARYDTVTAPLGKSPAPSTAPFGSISGSSTAKLDARYDTVTAPLKSPRISSGSFGSLPNVPPAPLESSLNHNGISLDNDNLSTSTSRELSQPTYTSSSSAKSPSLTSGEFGKWRPAIDEPSKPLERPSNSVPQIQIQSNSSTADSDTENSNSALTPTTQQNNLEKDIMKSFHENRSKSQNTTTANSIPAPLTQVPSAHLELRKDESLPASPAVLDPEIAALYKNTTHFLTRPISQIGDDGVFSQTRPLSTNAHSREPSWGPVNEDLNDKTAETEPQAESLKRASVSSYWDSDSDVDDDVKESERREREQQREMDAEREQQSEQISMPKNPARTPMLEDDTEEIFERGSTENDRAEVSSKKEKFSMLLSDSESSLSEPSDLASVSKRDSEVDGKYDYLARHGTTATTIVTPTMSKTSTMGGLSPAISANPAPSYSTEPDKVSERLNRAPVFDFRAILTKPRSEDRRAAFDDARRREVEYDCGLETWLATISSNTGAVGIITQPTINKMPPVSGHSRKPSFSKTSTFTHSLPSAFKPTAIKSGITSKLNNIHVGRVGEKSSSAAKGFFARSKKFIKSDK